MPLFETRDFVKTGQLKTCSMWQMLWLTRFKGYRIANTLHVPKRNMFGRLTTSRVWIVDRKEDRR